MEREKYCCEFCELNCPGRESDDPAKPFDWGAGLGAVLLLLWVAGIFWVLKLTVPSIWRATVEAFN